MSSDKSGVWFSHATNSPYGRSRSPGGNITLLIVDDHALYRKGLRSMFELEPNVQAIGEAADGSEALDKVEALHPEAPPRRRRSRRTGRGAAPGRGVEQLSLL